MSVFLLIPFISKAHKPYQRPIKKIGEETNVIEATEPLTILLMGVDTGNVERTDPWEGNSDSMILLTVNPHTKKNNDVEFGT